MALFTIVCGYTRLDEQFDIQYCLVVPNYSIQGVYNKSGRKSETLQLRCNSQPGAENRLSASLSPQKPSGVETDPEAARSWCQRSGV